MQEYFHIDHIYQMMGIIQIDLIIPFYRQDISPEMTGSKWNISSIVTSVRILF